MRTHPRSAVDQSPVWLALRRPDHPAVLIADADDAARSAYGDPLGHDCDVFTARDIEDMVRKAADLWPHVIVIDAPAANADGLVAIARVRQSSWTSGIRMIVVSEDPSVRDAAFASGCDAFLDKPLASHVLRAQIRALIEPPETRSLRQSNPMVPVRPAA
jgi:DNA-binding response OmpR family regulator